MKANNYKHMAMLLLTAIIWGIAFVAQSEGGDALGPFAFNSIRSIIGSIVLIPVIKLSDSMNLTKRKPATDRERLYLFKSGFVCGIVMLIASSFQQIGIYLGTSVGKAGFLTACYILIVPILSLLLGKKCGINIWIGVCIAIAGLYMLCMDGRFMIEGSDVIVLVCALAFSVHILVVDKVSPQVDGVRLSCIQFFVCGIVGLIPAFIVDMNHSISGMLKWAPALLNKDAWISLLYAGVMSCGVAYTLQIIGQVGVNPTIASMIMSLESVVSVIAGSVILNQNMKNRELLGCVLIFIAIIIAQLFDGDKKTEG